MTPVLYSKSASGNEFSKNGLGALSDCISATVTEERNGAYEAQLKYPVAGPLFSSIKEGCIVKMKPNDTSDPQLFRIYRVSKPINGIITYTAQHISYDLNGLPLAGFTMSAAAPAAVITSALGNNPFSASQPFEAWSDIATQKAVNIPTPCSVRGLLGGVEGSVLDTFGGEFEFDNFTVKLHEHRGADNGVRIEYGKNLIDLTQESNIEKTYTHVFPYALKKGDNGDVYVYLSSTPVNQVIALTSSALGSTKTLQLDMTSFFADDEEITSTALRNKANAYISSHNLGVPEVSIKVSFVPLWQSPEYASIAPLEHVSLCDSVTVEFSTLGVSAKAKVIKTVYDSLSERYVSVSLGDAKSNFANTVIKQEKALSETKETMRKNQSLAEQQLQRAIAQATAAITGASGGYVVLNPSNNPQEILIMDHPNISDAVNVWRWNSSGLGFSENGYEGPYRTAITADGHIVADFIDTGNLNASLITTGFMSADHINGGLISANNGKSVWDLDSGELTTTDNTEYNIFNKASIHGGSIVNEEKIECGHIVFRIIDSVKRTEIFSEGDLILNVPGKFRINGVSGKSTSVRINDNLSLVFENGILYNITET